MCGVWYTVVHCGNIITSARLGCFLQSDSLGATRPARLKLGSGPELGKHRSVRAPGRGNSGVSLALPGPRGSDNSLGNQVIDKNIPDLTRVFLT